MFVETCSNLLHFNVLVVIQYHHRPGLTFRESSKWGKKPAQKEKNDTNRNSGGRNTSIEKSAAQWNRLSLQAPHYFQLIPKPPPSSTLPSFISFPPPLPPPPHPLPRSPLSPPP